MWMKTVYSTHKLLMSVIKLVNVLAHEVGRRYWKRGRVELSMKAPLFISSAH